MLRQVSTRRLQLRLPLSPTVRRAYIPVPRRSTPFRSRNRIVYTNASAVQDKYVEEEDGFPVVTTDTIEAEAQNVDTRLPVTVRAPGKWCALFTAFTRSRKPTLIAHSSFITILEMEDFVAGHHWVPGFGCVPESLDVSLHGRPSACAHAQSGSVLRDRDLQERQRC